MAAKLIAEAGTYAGAEYPVGAQGAVLGRLKNNDIEVPDTKASRRHTRVGRQDGVWFVEDLKSSNGTFLNGAKVEWAEITSGDRISIGKTVYRFEADDESGPVVQHRAAAAAPAPARASAPRPAAKPAARPAASSAPPARRRPAPAVEEPAELRLEEPEELGLDDAEAPAAATAPVAPRAPAPETPRQRPAVSATGHGIVARSGPLRPGRAGLLTQDVGQRDWRFQAVIWAVAIAIFVGLTWGAFRLMDHLLGDPAEAQPVGTGAAGE